MSKGTFIFVLFGVRAALSRTTFPLPGAWVDDSDGVEYTSDGCTTLPSHNQIKLRLIFYSRDFLVSGRQVPSELA